MKPLYNTFELWAKETLDERDVMFFTAVSRQLSLDRGKELERLSELFYGNSDAVHEVLNELEVETIVRMYGKGYSVTDISLAIGERDNKFVLSQLFMCNKISAGDLDTYWSSDYDYVQDVLNSVSVEEVNKPYMTKDQIIQELVKYMNSDTEEDFVIPKGSYSEILVYLQPRVKHYIDNFRTRVTVDDIMEIALTVINRMD